ncbi:hypothetical protein NEU84_004756 [Salmonella enterica]|nr:hypothetical protein [Salmonella enterica]
MAKSNKERQKQYRLSRTSIGQLGEYRINTFVSGDAYFNMKLLARHYNISQKQVIELLINTANKAIISKLEPDSPEWVEYFKPYE